MSEARRRREWEAIIFDGLVLAFVGALVVAALSLNEKSRLVPLLVGVPTLLAFAYQLVRDLRGHPPVAEAAPELDASIATAGIDRLMQVAAGVEAEDDELPSTPEARRRQALFAAWACGVVALAALTTFQIAAPLGLLAILLAGSTRRWVAVAITAGATLALYLLFDLFLNVHF